MEQYLPIVLLLALGAAFAAGSFAASKLLGPSRPTGAKEGPYESGIASEGGESVRFPVRFFMVAMIFIIFDIEVVFLYPWAVDYHQLNLFGLGEMAAFALVVFISFAYLVSNGALDWGPRRRSARQDSAVTRTMSSTVRRVPRPSELAQGTDTIARYEQGETKASPAAPHSGQPRQEPGPSQPGPGESEPVPAGS
ncbi:MAG: NADH-quinone oxidoreductase subunit A [Actinomycetota bacterium]|nr:NADH-quinone oxidoreductase subunit A [Actinomycetota bacterium]